MSGIRGIREKDNRSWGIRADELFNLLPTVGNKRDVEAIISGVLHDKETITLIQNSIRSFMPRSNVKPWAGKLPHAKDSAKSLRADKENLAVTIRTTSNYQYLYFPDDGHTTDNHYGNQQFFARGGEAVKDDIIDRCIAKITEKF